MAAAIATRATKTKKSDADVEEVVEDEAQAAELGARA